jgi:hypothetical protein
MTASNPKGVGSITAAKATSVEILSAPCSAGGCEGSTEAAVRIVGATTLLSVTPPSLASIATIRWGDGDWATNAPEYASDDDGGVTITPTAPGPPIAEVSIVEMFETVTDAADAAEVSCASIINGAAAPSASVTTS